MDATRLLAVAALLMISSQHASAQSNSRYGSEPNYGDSRYASTSGDSSDARYADQSHVPTQIYGKPDFGIPLNKMVNEQSIGEVRLFVSSKQGNDWSFYQRRPPSAKGFQFQADRDGEYWFAVQTTDRSGRVISEEPIQPELKVIIDTTQPRLDVRVTTNRNGTATAEWFAEDLHLASNSFRLFYDDGRGKWQSIPVETPNDRRQQWQGSTDWRLPQGLRQVQVLAEVYDMAENQTRVTKRASGIDYSQSANHSQSVNHSQSANHSQAASRPRFDHSEFDGRGVATHGGIGGGVAVQGSQTTAGRNRSEAVGGTWQDLTSGLGKWFGGVRQPDTENHGAAQDRRFQNTTHNSARPPISPVTSRNAGLAKSPVQNPVAQQNRPGFQSNTSNRRNTASVLTGRPRITSSPNFEIDYELQGIGQRGAKTVELWSTRDEGRTWELYGSDPDRQSPMEVRLTQEGLYGFRLLVHGYDSAPPAAPQDFEPPDIWVAADWTKPTGRITRATLRDTDTGQPYSGIGRELVIDWIAEDALLAEQPISISIAAAPDGPWTPIASMINNSGTYRWPVNRELPSRLYLQLQIRDIAGNVTSDVYDAGASNQSGQPAAIIRDIRPVGRSAYLPVERR